MTRSQATALVLAVLSIAALLLPLPSTGGGSTTYPWPTNWSLGGLASWSQPLIASGAALPATSAADTGDLFITVDGATATLYRMQGGAWATMSSGTGGSGGTTDHAAPSNLGYAAAGHTGFASSTSITDVRAEAATVSASLTSHIADTTDPHGATETITSSILVGSGTQDTYLERSGTGTMTLASYARILPTTATPTDIVASGTLWYDANVGALKCYDGSTWHALW